MTVSLVGFLRRVRLTDFHLRIGDELAGFVSGFGVPRLLTVARLLLLVRAIGRSREAATVHNIVLRLLRFPTLLVGHVSPPGSYRAGRMPRRTQVGFAINARNASSVSASSGFLSARQRRIRGNRTATPDLCRGDG